MTKQRETRDRLAATYHVALEAAHRSACVSIHVGQQVWDDLQALVRRDGVTSDEKVSLCWGYPIVLEAAWPPETIKVRTETIIA